VKRHINEFRPNSIERRAAEIAAGLTAVGAITTWAYDDLEGRFLIELATDTKPHYVNAQSVIDMGRGVLAFMAHAQDMLSVGATLAPEQNTRGTNDD
jgi:hypothetical protein